MLKKACIFRELVVLGSVIFSGLANALPIVSVDTDTLTPGIQSLLSTTVGDTLIIDVVITGVDAAAPLNAFEFDLDFDPAILTATGIVSGDFLPLGFGVFPPVIVESDIASPDVNYAEATVGPFGSIGDGILASVIFDVIGLGTSDLDINDIILSAPFGVPIALDSVNDSTIIANAPDSPAPVPAPPIFLLLGIGLGVLRLFVTTQRQYHKCQY